MKYFTFTFLSILILSSITLAQALDTMWTKTFGGSTEDYGECVQQTTDGGYIITGYTNSFGAGGRDVYLIKTDTNGDELWTQTLGGSNNDWSYSVQQTTDGGYIIAGQTSSYGVGAGTYNVYLVKTDMNGNESWHQTYGGSNNDVGYSVQQTTDGGYIIGGYTESYGAGSFDVYLIKTDAMGDESWSRTFGGSSNDVGYSIQQTIDGGYIIGGYTNSYGAGGNDVYLIKTDTEGNESWHQTYGGSTGDTGKSVQQTTDGGYIIAGNTDSYGAGSLDVYLIKTDVNGNEDWTKTYGGSNWDVGGCAQQTSDEGYIITGSTGSYGVGDYNVYLIKTDTNGDTLCTQTYGGSDNDRGYSVQQTTDGGYIVIGYTASYGVGEIDVYLIKLEREDEFYFTCDEPNLPGFIGSTATFYSELTNITAGEVTVHLNLDTTGYPADWDCSWSVGGVALPSFIFDWETTLGGGSTDTITVNMIPNSMLDEASVTISAYPLNNPSFIQEITFTINMFKISPTELDFPDLEIGCTDSNWVYAVNMSGIAVTVDSVLNSLAVFNFDPDIIGATVPANDSLGFWVSFAPEEAVGYNDTLNVESGGAVLTVALSGMGLEIVPAEVHDLTISIEGNDAVLNWTAVDTSILGNPIIVDAYLIFFKQIEGETFNFLATSTVTTHTHESVVQFSPSMFYEVEAYIGEIGLLDELLASQDKVTRDEVRKLMYEQSTEQK